MSAETKVDCGGSGMLWSTSPALSETKIRLPCPGPPRCENEKCPNGPSPEGPCSPDDGDVLSEKEWIAHWNTYAETDDPDEASDAWLRLRNHDQAVRQRLRDAEEGVKYHAREWNIAIDKLRAAEDRAWTAEERERRLRAALERAVRELESAGSELAGDAARTALRGEEPEAVADELEREAEDPR